ncbi:MAG: FAD:protein FMN transferase [Bauldia sp.]|nr:FAD:protein FMN transferase [Bauldia sp.]
MSISRREVLLGGAALMMAPALPAHGAGATVVGGPAFGSYWRLALPDTASAPHAGEAVQAVVSAIDASMSPYRSTSALSHFNLARTTDWIPLPDEVCVLVAASLGVATATEGAFDPTVGPMVGRFGFGPIIEGSTTGSYRGLEVAEGAVRKTSSDLTLDLCGIAKGYALDRAADALAAIGESDFLLELGGEVLARGAHPSGRPWQVGVEMPFAPAGTIGHLVRPASLALATSGPATQSYEVEGRIYSHVVDPRLHALADGSIASVTVMMPTGVAADAYATALMAMGAADAIPFAELRAIRALFQLWTGGSLSERTTAGFNEFIET